MADDFVSVICFLIRGEGLCLFLSAALFGVIGRCLVGVSLSGLLAVNYGFLVSGIFFSNGCCRLSHRGSLLCNNLGSSLFFIARLNRASHGRGLVVVIIVLICIVGSRSLGCKHRYCNGRYLSFFLSSICCSLCGAGNDLRRVNVLEDEGSQRTKSLYYLTVSILNGSLLGCGLGRSVFSCESLLCHYCCSIFLSSSYCFLSIFSRFSSSFCCGLSGVCGFLSEVSRFLGGLIILLEGILGRNFSDISFGRFFGLVCIATSFLGYYVLISGRLGRFLCYGLVCIATSFLRYYLALISGRLGRSLGCAVVCIGSDSCCNIGILLIIGGFLFCNLALACDYSCSIGILKDMRSKRTKIADCVLICAIGGVARLLDCAVFYLGYCSVGRLGCLNVGYALSFGYCSVGRLSCLNVGYALGFGYCSVGRLGCLSVGYALSFGYCSVGRLSCLSVGCTLGCEYCSVGRLGCLNVGYALGFGYCSVGRLSCLSVGCTLGCGCTNCLRNANNLNGNGAITLALNNLGGIIVNDDASAGCGLTCLGFGLNYRVG